MNWTVLLWSCEIGGLRDVEAVIETAVVGVRPRDDYASFLLKSFEENKLKTWSF